METTIYTIGGVEVSQEEAEEYDAMIIAEYEEEEYGRLDAIKEEA